jgi:hypothetical protein
MTNYCQNRLTVSGPAQEIDAFAQNCLAMQYERLALDFEKIHPKPPILKGAHRGPAAKLGGDFSQAISTAVLGMEALRRAPLPQQLGFDGTWSILDHARAKALGIKTYDDLETWVRKNNPEALELGRKCLAAHAETGYCFEEDWEFDKWGCDDERVDCDWSHLGETRYEATFSSPHAAPEGIFREIARRHPELTIRVAAIEEGNDYAYVLTSRNGVVEEENPDITDALIEEVEGPEELEEREELDRSYYEPPSQLKEPPMRHFRHWLGEARFKRRLAAGYPVYDPPHRGVEMLMTEKDARENYDFFLAQKAGRVENLRRFLAPFGVSLDFTEQTKAALDHWLAAYAAFLYVHETGSSFLTRNPEWTDARLSLNVIFDLAIFLGDFAVHESPMLRWEMDVLKQPGRTRRDDEFQRPILAADTQLYPCRRDLIRETYDFCHARCEASYMWKESLFHLGSRALSRQFATKTLRNLYLRARGDFETANSEAWKDSLAG